MPVNAEIYDNPEPRFPMLLLLDTSGSMSGSPIAQLNAGVDVFKQEVERDELASLRAEVAIITFNNSAQLVQDFVSIDQFFPQQFTASGSTAMGQAIEIALNTVESRKAYYKSNGLGYFQPWIVLITDGEPTDSWQNAAQRVKQACAKQKLSFFAIGVQGANMNILGQIDSEPRKLEGLKFVELFRWLAASASAVSSSNAGDQVALPSISKWAVANT